MSIVFGALRDTIELVTDEPILIVGALCFMIFASISLLFSWVPLVGPIISIAWVAVGLVGYTTMIDAAITRRGSLSGFIQGIIEHWGQAAKVHLSIAFIFSAVWTTTVYVSSSVFPIPTARAGLDLITNPTLSPGLLLITGVFVAVYIPVVLLVVVQTLACASIVVRDVTGLKLIKKLIFEFFTTPGVMLGYTFARVIMIIAGTSVGIVIFGWLTPGFSLSITASYLFSEIYTVCHCRRRQEMLEHKDVATDSTELSNRQTTSSPKK